MLVGPFLISCRSHNLNCFEDTTVNLMAKSKWEYVKDFEIGDSILPDVFIVVRVDGRGFTKFCIEHELLRPIDERMIGLMDSCGLAVMESYPDIAMAYGESDEFSFVFRRDANTFNRRREKIVTTIVSLFTANFVMKWDKYFVNYPLKQIPSFDGRIVLYPKYSVVKDYLSWRQADTHINALYNYTLCTLLKNGIDPTTATEQLRGTVSEEKRQILIENGINYDLLPESHRKGSVFLRKTKVIHSNQDIISDVFWKQHKKFFK